MLYFLLYVLMIITANAAESRKTPRTRIKQGEVTGTFYTTYSGRILPAFYGIPFAAPPINELRFADPQPPRSWSKPLEATNKSDFCLQPMLPVVVAPTGSEDCLYLDVYTTNLPKEGKCDKLLPVMLYIHPSGSIATSGTLFEPYYIMDKHDMVFIPINYRLGALGFLTTGNEDSPGNFLYKDQVMAMKWVQENVEAFCGDPKLVTLAGSSQGGVCIAGHMLSPLSKGLFHRAIMASGNIYFYLNFHSEGKAIAKTVASQMNCPIDNTKEMIQCLRRRNFDLIFDYDLQYRTFFFTPVEVFGGTIEHCHEGAMFTKTPEKALADGDLKQDIPMLFTHNEFEGLVFVYMLAIPGIVELLDLTYKKNLKYIFDLYHMMPPHQFENASEAIKQHYFGDGLITGNEDGFKKMTTDGVFGQSLHKNSLKFARHSKSPVYNLVTTYRGQFSSSVPVSLTQTNKNYGAAHFDSDSYVIFNGLVDKKIRRNKKDLAMIKFMTELYYSFMVDGKPSVADKVGWKSQSKCGEDFDYLHFDNPWRMYPAKDDNFGNRKFWQSLPIDRYYGFPDDTCESPQKATKRSNEWSNDDEICDENDENRMKTRDPKKQDEMNGQNESNEQDHDMNQLHSTQHQKDEPCDQNDHQLGHNTDPNTHNMQNQHNQEETCNQNGHLEHNADPHTRSIQDQQHGQEPCDQTDETQHEKDQAQPQNTQNQDEICNQNEQNHQQFGHHADLPNQQAKNETCDQNDETQHQQDKAEMQHLDEMRDQHGNNQ